MQNNPASEAKRVKPNVDTLWAPFFSSPEEWGQIEKVTESEMPNGFRTLLAPHHHMTVAMEQHHGSPVSVRVLARHTDGEHYSRLISLTRQSDDAVVLTGVMRVNLDYLSDEACDAIRGESIPLGRILSTHNVLREVEQISLCRIVPGELFCDQLGMSPGETTFGRLALIHVDGEPAVELLEILSPI